MENIHMINFVGTDYFVKAGDTLAAESKLAKYLKTLEKWADNDLQTLKSYMNHDQVLIQSDDDVKDVFEIA